MLSQAPARTVPLWITKAWISYDSHKVRYTVAVPYEQDAELVEHDLVSS